MDVMTAEGHLCSRFQAKQRLGKAHVGKIGGGGSKSFSEKGLSATLLLRGKRNSERGVEKHSGRPSLCARGPMRV